MFHIIYITEYITYSIYNKKMLSTKKPENKEKFGSWGIQLQSRNDILSDIEDRIWTRFCHSWTMASISGLLEG